MAHWGGGADSDEPTGEPESLWGNIDPSLFGDRVYRGSPGPELKRKKEGDPRSEPALAIRRRKRQRSKEVSVLNDREEEEGVYQPTTRGSRAAYEALLSLIQQQLGGQPLDIVIGAADEILALLKNEGIKNPDKKEIDKLLNPIPLQVFDQFVSIGKLITDYQDMGSGGDEGLDEDHYGYGVAIEFNEDEDESDDDDDDDDDNGAMQMGGGIDDDDDDDDMYESNEGMTVDVQDIHAYWLQRKISLAYDQQIDPQQCYKLAEEVLNVLAEPEDDDKVVETKLLIHFQDKLSLIKCLLHNRLKVVWCTRLAKAQDQEERKKIEEEMMCLGPDLAAIVEQLHPTRATAKERQKKAEKSIREEARRLMDRDRRRGLADRDIDHGD